MTNLCRKHSSMKKTNGAAILVITVLLFVSASLALAFAANYSGMQQKTSTNLYLNNQASDAAEAGLEYAIAFLQSNSSTVLASALSGSLTYNLGPITLPNNATFSITITNPTLNNLTTLNITSIGTSANNAATTSMTQQVYSAPSSLDYTITTQGSMTVNGTGTINGNNGIITGSAYNDTGHWNVGGTISQHNTAIANMTPTEFFTSIFGISPSAQKAVSTVYSTSSGVDWSQLSGPVWIDAGVSLSGSTTIGSPTNPVLLIVNGPFVDAGNVIIHGILYSMGGITTSGSFTVTGGMASQGNIIMSGNFAAYDSATVNSLLGTGSFARVTGSWKDF